MIDYRNMTDEDLAQWGRHFSRLGFARTLIDAEMWRRIVKAGGPPREAPLHVSITDYGYKS